MIIFEQWDKLVRLFQNLAVAVAQDKNSYDFNRLMPIEGRVTLKDRAMNTLALGEGEMTLLLPDLMPGKARDFLLRVTLESGSGTFRLEGADVYEGEAGALDPPAEGETIVYLFSETSPGVFLVSRRTIRRLDV